MNRNLIILILIALLTGCEEEPTIHTKEYAVVQTEVREISSEGVLLGARVLSRGKSEIRSAGFIFGKQGQPDYRIVVEEFSDSFEYFLRADIPEGELYYVKAYVVTDDSESYGNIGYFKSQGFIKPPAVVEQITPQQVTDGHKVLLVGKNFSLQHGLNQIITGGKVCQVYFTGFDSIGFIMPSLSEGSHVSYLEVYGEQVAFGPMIVEMPELTSCSPQNGPLGSTVTIRGKYFGNSPRVYFGAINGILVSLSDTLIVARVPQFGPTGPVSLRIEVGGKQVTGSEQFIITDSSTGTSSLAAPGKEVSVSDKNLINRFNTKPL